MMIPIPVDGPAVEPVSLADMRLHLRLDGTEEDALVTSLIKAARLMLEAATQLKFVSQTWRVAVTRLPPGRVLRLPIAPVLSISAVRVFDETGSAAPVDPSLYGLRIGTEPVELVLKPAFPAAPGGLEVDFVAGYGAAPEDVPEPLRHALRMLATHWFENRGDGSVPESAQLPPDVTLMIAPYRRARLV